jgi:hypothetical protein
LRDKLAADIAALTAKAEAADAEDSDPQRLPAEIARCVALKEKLDAACAWLGGPKPSPRPRPKTRNTRTRRRPTRPRKATAAGRPSRPPPPLATGRPT